MSTTTGADLALAELDVTFLIADLAGFTALTEIHGSRHAAWVVTRYVEIVRATLHPRARLAERVGDAVLIVAPDAQSAVRTAVDVREATEREPLFPLLRVGVHGGPVIELNGSCFGTPLNLPWLVRRGATGPGLVRRSLDVGVPALALLMCGWLLVHTGWLSLAAAAGLAVIGLVVGRRRPERGTDASPPGPALEDARID